MKRKPDFTLPMQGQREVLEIYGWNPSQPVRAASTPDQPPPTIDTEQRISRLRAAVNGDDFDFEINGGSPFDDVKALLDEYDRLRALVP